MALLLPSHSTWLHTLRWPRWLCLEAARPVRWCVLWCPLPGWRSLEMELMTKKTKKTWDKTFLFIFLWSPFRPHHFLLWKESFLCCFSKSPTRCSGWETKHWARPQSNHFHFVFKFGFHVKVQGHTANIPQHGSTVLPIFFKTIISAEINVIHKTGPISSWLKQASPNFLFYTFFEIILNLIFFCWFPVCARKKNWLQLL